MKRSKNFTFKILPGLTLKVSLRKFRIARQRRTKLHSQLVLPLRLRGYRQLAITLLTQSKRRPFQKLPNFRLLAHYGIIVCGLCGMLYFSSQVNRPAKIEPVSASAIPDQPVYKNIDPEAIRSNPIKLDIPKIGLSTPIVGLGLNADQTVQVPPLHQNVTGWYKHGPSPGEKGAAVIIGHFDTYKGPSVFWKLKDITPGDRISVERENGSKIIFAVNSVEQFNKTNFPTERVYGNVDHAGLRLVTCSGAFVRGTGEYTHNIVVFASKIN